MRPFFCNLRRAVERDPGRTEKNNDQEDTNLRTVLTNSFVKVTVRQWRIARRVWGETLRAGRPLVGGFSFRGVSGLCTSCRCRPGSLALEVGQLPVIRTPWVAISVASSVVSRLLRTSSCVFDDCRQVGMRTLRSAQMVRVSFFTRNFGHYFYELFVCRVFSSRHIALGGALDDEEFFVVEGWGGGGVAGSLDSQVTRHQFVSVTHCIGDVM